MKEVNLCPLFVFAMHREKALSQILQQDIPRCGLIKGDTGRRDRGEWRGPPAHTLLLLRKPRDVFVVRNVPEASCKYWKLTHIYTGKPFVAVCTGSKSNSINRSVPRRALQAIKVAPLLRHTLLQTFYFIMRVLYLPALHTSPVQVMDFPAIVVTDASGIAVSQPIRYVSGRPGDGAPRVRLKNRESSTSGADARTYAPGFDSAIGRRRSRALALEMLRLLTSIVTRLDL
ncbi:hypothetical protein EVAR_28844_1 [Eumeta japonica]|uniref:Uncharacterized protein n=1 Tax=Eumeta variegata TaxID=151549 RepID=A0A4C1YK31_EUMVA|nr:hypothetical protein EVAR_28844_1 [Eumeta japonica]